MKGQLGVNVEAGPPGGVVGSRVTGWRAVGTVLRSTVQTIVDDAVAVVFPADCRCCEGPLLRAGTVPVCEACVGRVRSAKAAACQRCAEALELDLDLEDLRFAGLLPEGFLCRECRLAPPEFARAVAYGDYQGELRGLIRLLKFGHVAAVAKLLGSRMAECMLKLESEAAPELLVIAVPLFPRRERQRGYNQSVLLADAALRRLRSLRPCWRLTAAHRALERRRSTESSFVLSRKGRRRNLRGAFHVSADVGGREVLLVDDILTSGATARECARVLMQAGAAKVWVATLARAQKRSAIQQPEDAAELTAKWDLEATVQ